jgi:hypothetical protein
MNNSDEQAMVEVTKGINSSKLSVKHARRSPRAEAPLNRITIQEMYSKYLHTKHELDNQIV